MPEKIYVCVQCSLERGTGNAIVKSDVVNHKKVTGHRVVYCGKNPAVAGWDLASGKVRKESPGIQDEEGLGDED